MKREVLSKYSSNPQHSEIAAEVWDQAIKAAAKVAAEAYVGDNDGSSPMLPVTISAEILRLR